MRRLQNLLLVLGLTFLAASCVKEDPTYPFRIVVQGENGVRVQNAYVRCFVPLPNVDIEYTGETGLNGIIDFEHDGGEVVVQIQVTKGNSSGPAAVGCGFLKLEPNEKVQATIVVSEYDPEDPGCQ